jgi:hypothetical protein
MFKQAIHHPASDTCQQHVEVVAGKPESFLELQCWFGNLIISGDMCAGYNGNA